MLFDPSFRADLRNWLIKSLEPICDADPVILADYVLALLNHSGPEQDLRKMFMKQLDEFLERETAGFVDSLFSALRSKAYIPYSNVNPPTPPANPIRISPDAGIPIPLDALVPSPSSPVDRGRKRPYDPDGREQLDRPPPKGPRMHQSGAPSRYSESRDSRNRPGSDWDKSYSLNNRPQQERGDLDGIPTRPRRRDQQGHEPLQPSNGEIRDEIKPADGKDQPAPGFRPLCRDYHNKGYCARGALCNYSHGQDAIIPPAPMWIPPDNPGFPAMMGMNFLPMMMPFGMPSAPNAFDGGAYDPNESHIDMTRSSANGLSTGADTNKMVVDEQDSLRQEVVPSINGVANDFNAHAPGTSANRGRGHKSRQLPRGANKDDKTLVIEKIPPEHLQLDSVNSWFKKFGTITNVAVDIKGAKALITFASHDEAALAWRAEDAIFGNRFVKVYWHKPMEGQGIAGKKALEASASLVQNLTVPVIKAKSDAVQQNLKSVEIPVKSRPAHMAPEDRAKAKALEKNIAEQKILFSRLKSATGMEKAGILARLRVLSDGMENPLATPPSTVISSSTSNIKTEDSTKLEMLDKELDLQQAVQDLTRRAQDPNEDHTAIRRELEKLTAKAAAEGIFVGDDSDRNVDAAAPTGYRPYRSRGSYRGRGRGRGTYRGQHFRTGTGRSLKLDNRPKQLVVHGVPVEDDSQLEYVREWHQASGSADTFTVTEEGKIFVLFKTRGAAEQALANTAALKTRFNQVKVSWNDDEASATSGHEQSTGEHVSTAPEDKEESGWGHDDYD